MAQKTDVSHEYSETEQHFEQPEEINEFYHGEKSVILIVENKRIKVYEAVLRKASPVFDSKLKGQTEMTLPGKKYQHVNKFLQYIHPGRERKVTGRNVYMLLPLAHEYEVREMKNECQKFLVDIVKNQLNANAKELYRHIDLSETYSLDALKETCKRLASERPKKQLDAARKLYNISDETHQKIVELALDNRDDLGLWSKMLKRLCY